jgi:hypothetical protein
MKVHDAIYQNHLLASEGGVCGKFNLSNCCLQIDDKGKVIEEITDKRRKSAHVPVWTWRGWTPNYLFGGWFSALGGFKALIRAMALVLGACLISPCLVPWYCVYQDHYGATHVMMLWKYKSLNQDDSL